ncbi:hypothetical protein BU23DRAFT_565416 [Bimuria novae-zelandiae CBS 107.79]|uniref:Uncharacterized protein n=1 Tax=Bimuria novae-zelandiae CBS 107.79 TaxID=1447943 RepID=A0A6A5VU06_9PLEO|nr:hypothetical protein BU23DRAFT_565416 [Bimuria novae-zelandiae CBS 107.79]
MYEKELPKQERGGSREECWRRIFLKIFPFVSDELVPSPYLDGVEDDDEDEAESDEDFDDGDTDRDQDKFRKRVRSELPDRVHAHLQRRIEQFLKDKGDSAYQHHLNAVHQADFHDLLNESVLSALDAVLAENVAPHFKREIYTEKEFNDPKGKQRRDSSSGVGVPPESSTMPEDTGSQGVLMSTTPTTQDLSGTCHLQKKEESRLRSTWTVTSDLRGFGVNITSEDLSTAPFSDMSSSNEMHKTNTDSYLEAFPDSCWDGGILSLPNDFYDQEGGDQTGPMTYNIPPAQNFEPSPSSPTSVNQKNDTSIVLNDSEARQRPLVKSMATHSRNKSSVHEKESTDFDDGYPGHANLDDDLFCVDFEFEMES